MRGTHEDSGISDESEAPLSETLNHETVLASVDPEIVKAVVKPLLGVTALVFLLLIVSVLPGLHQVIPATPITFAALVIAILTLVIVGVLIYVAPQIEKLVLQETSGSNALASNVAAVSKNLAFLLAVFLAHWGLAGALLPFLTGTNVVWIYDVTFLVLALIPTAHISRHLYRGLDPAAEVLTQRITDSPDTGGDSRSRRLSKTAGGHSGEGDATETAGPSTEEAGPGSSSVLARLRAINLRKWLLTYLQGQSTTDHGVLTKEERVLQILEEHDGRVQQTTLVELTGWSKSTVSRVLSEMKEDDIIVKTNIGQGNLIALPGKEPESLRIDGDDRI